MTIAAADFAKRLDQTADDTERLLAQLLSDTLLPDEIARPKRLMDAMRYSSLGGSKPGGLQFPSGDTHDLSLIHI